MSEFTPVLWVGCHGKVACLLSFQKCLRSIKLSFLHSTIENYPSEPLCNNAIWSVSRSPPSRKKMSVSLCVKLRLCYRLLCPPQFPAALNLLVDGRVCYILNVLLAQQAN